MLMLVCAKFFEEWGLERIKQRTGAQISLAVDAEDILSIVKFCGNYDCVLADEEIVGHNFPLQFRRQKNHMGLIIFSSDKNTGHIADLLKLGADHVLGGGFFDLDLLCAHINAIVRRCKDRDSSKLSFGDVTINTESFETWVCGQPIHLTPREFLTLQCLMEGQGRVISKETMLDSLYGGAAADDIPDSKIIDIFVCKLRKKLVSALNYDPIGTKWKRGYYMEKVTPLPIDQSQSLKLELAEEDPEQFVLALQ
ncbi:MAG TPA: response regulator transcription factor [Candidatus Paceibacterota bacterium]|jgi:two-component system cell cycle response regulator CtrA